MKYFNCTRAMIAFALLALASGCCPSPSPSPTPEEPSPTTVSTPNGRVSERVKASGGHLETTCGGSPLGFHAPSAWAAETVEVTLRCVEANEIEAIERDLRDEGELGEGEIIAAAEIEADISTFKLGVDIVLPVAPPQPGCADDTPSTCAVVVHSYEPGWSPPLRELGVGTLNNPGTSVTAEIAHLTTLVAIRQPVATMTPASPTPTNTPTPRPCADEPPSDWQPYTVQRGDTLYSLARRIGTTMDLVIFYNCLQSTQLWAGQQLYLPALPTPTNTPTSTPTPAPAIEPQDCLPYNPANLRIVDEGANGWLLTDGVSRMLILDNETDARNALALAQRHTAHCFIGRGNTRPNRKDYIVEYWTGDSGLATTIGPEDCLPYNPANLQIVDEGANGWLLTDGVSRMLILDNETDARNALALAQRHAAQCFIGRGNTRPNRKDYIVEYWK